MQSVQTIYKSLPEGKSLLYGWFEAMHTRIDVILCNVEEERGKNLLNKVQQEINHITNIVNRFNENSELAHVNQNGYKQEVELSPILFFLIDYCIQACQFTSGHFDITIQSDKNYTQGITGIKLNRDFHTIRFKTSQIQLDLCGIAKGYALDKCRELLEQEGIKDMLISFGNSSIAGWGNHPYGKGWLISGNENSFLPGVSLQNEYLTISGNETSESGHLINPQSKTYIKHHQEIAVKTQSGILGEVLSTAYFVADLKIREWLKNTHSDTAIFYN